MCIRYKYADDVYHRVCNQITTTGVTSGAGTAYSSGAPDITSGFQRGSCYSIFSCICMFCRSLLVHFILVIALSGLFRYTYSDYPFGISKLFLGGLPLFMLSNYMSPVFRSVHRCPRKNDIRLSLLPFVLQVFFCFMLFVFMYVHCMQLLNYLATHTLLSPIRRGFAPGFITKRVHSTRIHK